MEIQAAINAMLQRQDLQQEEMESVMRTIMTGAASPAQIGGFLFGLRMKGETVAEVTAAAKVMRELASRVEIAGEHVVDTCGTGGDAASTFNISTASAFVVAADGGRVAKHGNRSISSKSGSADLLEAAGVNLNLNADQVAECVDKIGVGFMFAPLHHSAMKHAIGPRKEMGVRTIFNVLGPLTNPAGAPNQVIGVFAKEWVEPLAEVLKELGSRHVMVVHSEDGMDEISISAPTYVAELNDGAITTYTIQPEDFGMQRAPISSLGVDGAEASLQTVKSVLAGERGPAADIVALNAGAAIYVSGLADSLAVGVNRAQRVLLTGHGLDRLNALAELTQTMQK